MTAGYSGTPLAAKLGLKRGQRVWFRGLPDSVRAELDLLAIGVVEQSAAGAGLDYAHVFAAERADLAEQLSSLRGLIRPAGVIWASWPKRAAKVRTDVTEDGVREIALPLGLVDVKVCAVDEIWSGLKLVIRTTLRT